MYKSLFAIIVFVNFLQIVKEKMKIYELGKEIGPCIFVFDNFLNDTEKIIKLALKKSNKTGVYDATVFGDEGLEKTDLSIRNTSLIDISPTFKNDVEWWLIAQKIWSFGDMYGVHHNASFSDMESPQFLHYKKNEGFYKEHVDDDPKIYPRIFSSVIYLNDVDLGGETYFPKFNLSVKPRAGRLLMFPSGFAYVHGAKTPISNDKYAIVSWFKP
jgi:predicted 2-oxoglutarate/Fe(II)-dependent dioxygenase YbiX